MIASLVTAHERYGYAELPIFMLAREGEVVADDSRRVRFEALDTYTDELTGKPVATRTLHLPRRRRALDRHLHARSRPGEVAHD